MCILLRDRSGLLAGTSSHTIGDVFGADSGEGKDADNGEGIWLSLRSRPQGCLNQLQ